MLTDEEKRAIREKVSKDSGEWHFDLMLFATEIERAVLAKAGEQEPLRYVLMGSDGEVVGKLFQTKIQSENYAESMLVGNFTATAIYAHPLPAQAIPDKIKPATRTLESMGYANGFNDCIDLILSASPKP